MTREMLSIKGKVICYIIIWVKDPSRVVVKVVRMIGEST